MSNAKSFSDRLNEGHRNPPLLKPTMQAAGEPKKPADPGQHGIALWDVLVPWFFEHKPEIISRFIGAGRFEHLPLQRWVIPRVRGKRREVWRMLARLSQELLARYRRGDSNGEEFPLRRVMAGL